MSRRPLRYAVVLVSACLAMLVSGAALAVKPQLAAGGHHSLYLKPDGTVLAWGENGYAQLGDGSTTDRLRPIVVPGLNGVIQVAVGEHHSLALKSDGTVMAWGGNGYGQLGDSNPSSRSTPMVVPNLSSVVAIAAGNNHSLAVKADGTVLAWGKNYDGQLGDGSTTNRSSPVVVLGLTGAAAVAAGERHSLALKSNGTVMAWGLNVNGQLGDGSNTNRLTPVPVPGLIGVTAVVAGNQHSLAVLRNGVVMAWGWNYYGQLGDGNTANHFSPVYVPALSGAIAVAAGTSNSLSLKSDGTVLACGLNSFGQLGDGSVTDRLTPMVIPGLTGVIAVATGFTHSLSLKSDGTVLAWGNNADGQLGDGSTTNRLAPVTTLALDGGNISTGELVAMTAGSYHGLALKANGTVLAWGENLSGELGDGSITTRSSPVVVPGLGEGVVAVVAGAWHSLALKSDGALLAWGDNRTGQLGDGSTTNRSNPVAVTGLGKGSGVVAVAAGFGHTLALKKNGTVMAWGSNVYGQLGDGSTTDRHIPVLVPGLTNVVAVAAGGWYSLALKGDGTVVAWGDNRSAQLGDSSFTNRASPVLVAGLGKGSGVVAVSGGDFHSLALKSDGTVLSWGNNYYGELGNGGEYTQVKPAPVPGLAKVVAVSAGDSHSLALKADGTVLAWGWNIHGEVGDGTLTIRRSPVPVSHLGSASGVVAVSAGWAHSLALKSDGTLLAWGNGRYAELGDGSQIDRHTPVPIDDLFPSARTLPTDWLKTVGTTANWTVSVDRAIGPQSLKSGSIGNSAHSGIQYKAAFREGFVTFQRKVSSEAGGDFLRFYVDGELKGEWSGDQDWGRAGAFVRGGIHTLAWEYEKNASGAAGLDAAWIDSVSFTTVPAKFNDVPASHWAFYQINTLSFLGITSGCGNGNYCPNQTVTREQMAAFLVREVEGEPSSACAAAPFGDVPITHYFCKYIQRMSVLGITNGCGNNNFCPGQNVTREQMAAFIVRAREGEPPANYCGATAPFADVSVSSASCGYIKRMAELGITTGCGNGNYCPGQVVTRDQMAVFLMRAFPLMM